MLFGEVQQGTLKIKNNTNVAVSEAIVYSQDPLFTGFRLKRLGRIEANSAISHTISLRATMINAQELCFALFYKSEIQKPEGRVVAPNLWRVTPFYVGMQIKSSFTLKCHNETIAENQRLVCIDTLSKISPQLDPAQVSVSKLIMFSKNWKIVENSQKISRVDGAQMIYLKIEEVKSPEESFYELSRKQREVFALEGNTIELESDSTGIKMEGFLKHENEELTKDAISTQKLSDYIDFAIFWKYKASREVIYGLHSLTSVLVKSITQLGKEEKHEGAKARVALRTEKMEFEHNFATSGNLILEVEAKIDLTNLNTETESVSIKAIEPNMIRDERGEICFNVDSTSQIFNWFGLTECVVRRPFTEHHVAKFKCVLPNPGIFNLNTFVLVDLATNKEIKYVGSCEQYFVKVTETLL